jgi:hypothetical protein
MTRSLGALLMLWAIAVCAEPLPQFQLDASAWLATDIVVVTEGESIDGRVEVLQSWKGDLKPGDSITVPALAAFASAESRAVSKWFDQSEAVPRIVSGSRMILFLIRKGDGWHAADAWSSEIRVSTAWIEGDQVFAFNQQTVPGALQLLALELHAPAVKRRVEEILAVQRKFADKRSDVARLMHIDSIYVRRFIISALGERGPDGLPGLRAILKDRSLEYEHVQAIIALAKAGGASVAPDLTEILREELSDRGPNRYAKTFAALRALRPMHFTGARDVVRATWNVWPDEVQIGRECMNLLADLP